MAIEITKERYLPFVGGKEVAQDSGDWFETLNPADCSPLASVARGTEADATLALFEPRPADYFDPPATVCEAMLRSDLNILVATTGMLHAPANFAAMEAGVPSICMDGGLTLEMFQSGAVEEDPLALAIMKHRVGVSVFGRDASEPLNGIDRDATRQREKD